MIGIGFLVRLGQLLVALVLLAVVLVAFMAVVMGTWYAVSRMFQHTWDTVEERNMSFGEWFAGKLERLAKRFKKHKE